MKRVAVIQPGYLPWLGFFELIASSDVFVIYDDVQFDKNGWRNRNRIKTAEGPQWLTIPVLIKGKNKPLNNEVNVKEDLWRKKHLKSLQHNYVKSKYFNDVFGILEKGLNEDTDKLIDIDMFFVNKIKEYLGIKTDVVLSSDLGVDGGNKTDRLINICRKFGGTHYYNGAAGKELYKKEDFASLGVTLEFQDYKHPVYTQLYGEFVPYLSVVDLLFNEGKASLDIILSGRGVS